jgi:hypothetical protein
MGLANNDNTKNKTFTCQELTFTSISKIVFIIELNLKIFIFFYIIFKPHKKENFFCLLVNKYI